MVVISVRFFAVAVIGLQLLKVFQFFPRVSHFIVMILFLHSSEANAEWWWGKN